MMIMYAVSSPKLLNTMEPFSSDAWALPITTRARSPYVQQSVSTVLRARMSSVK